MYRTGSLVQYFPRLPFLNFIFNFLYLVSFSTWKCMLMKQNVNSDVTKDSPISSTNLAWFHSYLYYLAVKKPSLVKPYLLHGKLLLVSPMIPSLAHCFFHLHYWFARLSTEHYYLIICRWHCTQSAHELQTMLNEDLDNWHNGFINFYCISQWSIHVSMENCRWACCKFC